MIKRLLGKFVQYSKLTSEIQYSSTIYHQQQYLSLFIKAKPATNFFHNDTRSIACSPMDPTLSIQQQDNETRLRAHKICSDHLGDSWSKISPDELLLMPISGGMSNAVFCCSLPESVVVSDGEPAQVLLRLYGDQWRNCDMTIQLKIFELLSSKGLGPKLYGDFEDGRLEEFLPASSLTCDELMNSDISSIIAKKVAAVHSLDVPIDKNTTWLFERLNEWVEYVKEQCEVPAPSEDIRQSTIDIARELLAIDFLGEIKFLRGVIERTCSPVVFSHNDLHQGNILLAKCSKRRSTLEERVVLIDFEYCSYNYRAYDIANHFCEWCFEYDTPDYPHFTFFKDRFPSKENQRNFVRHYVNKRRQLLQANSATGSITSLLSKLNNDASSANTESNGEITGRNNVNSCNDHYHARTHDNSNRSPNGRHHLNNGHHSNKNTSGSGGSYCESSSSHNSSGISNTSSSNFSNSSHSNIEAASGSAVEKEEEEVLMAEINPFFMAANLLWTVWCIKSAQCSTTKFGFWEHSMARWKLYSAFKDSFIRASMSRTNGNSAEKNKQMLLS